MAEESRAESDATSQRSLPDGTPPLWPLPSPNCAQFAYSGKGYSFGWHSDGFEIAQQTLIRKQTVRKFPLTEEGWNDAWRFLTTELPQLAGAVLRQISQLPARQSSPNAESQAWANAESQARAQLAALGVLAYLKSCAFLGGYGHADSLAPGVGYDLYFTNEGLTIAHQGWSIPLVRSSYAEAEAMEFTGPGRVTKGGGFFGGGFGLKGAAEGMIVASVLNSLTTKSSIQTIVRWEAQSLELFFFTSEATPADLRIRMSPVLGRVKSSQGVEAAPPIPDADPVSQLERLATLRQQGVIDDEEFAELKRKIISGS